MSVRAARIGDAFAALDRGDATGFAALFVEDARWLGVPGSGPEGETPT